MQIKFRTGINAILSTFVIIFNIVILLLLTSRIFVTTNVGWIFGVFLLIIDACLIIPMLYLTGYEFKDEYLLVKDWPFRRYKIRYDSIFDIKDGDFDAKNKRMVALSYNRIAIAYKEKQKDDTEKEMYMFVSPADMSLFLVRISGKLKQSEALTKQKTEALSAAQKEHELKKKEAKNKRAEKKAKLVPEIIEANEIKKFSGFSEESNDTDK